MYCRFLGCVSRSRLKLESQQTAHGQSKRLKRSELASHSQLCKSFILSQEGSVESQSIMNPQPHPSGCGLCFLMPFLAPHYFTHWYVYESFFGMRWSPCGDDTETRLPREVSLVSSEEWCAERAQKWPEAAK